MMELNTTHKEYIDTVQLIEIYQRLQDIIDRTKTFCFAEAYNDKEKMIGWLMQLEEIKRDAEQINDMKCALLNQATSKMMDFIGEE